MPGQAIGTELPRPTKTIFSARISIPEQSGKFISRWNYEGDVAIAQRLQKLLDEIAAEHNS